MSWGREMEVLSHEECFKLMEMHPGHVGRIAMEGPRPDILPVNYAVDGKSVVFRTDPGKKLHAAIHRAFVAFEVDWVEPDWQIGWSVLLRGQAHLVDDPQEIERLQRLPLSPWEKGRKEHFVRVTPQIISGRRLK